MACSGVRAWAVIERALSMSNPWFDIPLEDYESHMSLPTVGQGQLIARQMEDLVLEHEPASVAVIGCAGGNGFERLVGSIHQ
jgi:hypothetical protein